MIGESKEIHDIGECLLGEVVGELRTLGHRQVWLASSPDPAVRAHGFYRAQRWRPSGEMDATRDEILVLEI